VREDILVAVIGPNEAEEGGPESSWALRVWLAAPWHAMPGAGDGIDAVRDLRGVGSRAGDAVE
jgi:hypothetical protein